ncbi:hypothetical protein PMAYCL1PPCAC_15445, partial [Pristionchus mayeri]
MESSHVLCQYSLRSMLFTNDGNMIIIVHNSASPACRRLFRTICIVMAIDVSGWTITTIILFLVFGSNLREGTQFALHYFAGLAVNSAIAFKAIVYYLT